MSDQLTDGSSVGTATRYDVIAGKGSDGLAHPLAVNTTGQLVSAGPATGTLTDRSGTITNGGTAQTLAVANTSRRYLLIQNNSSGALWVNFTATAVTSQPSLQIAANGGSLVMESSYVSTEPVSIIGATTGQAFTAKEG